MQFGFGVAFQLTDETVKMTLSWFGALRHIASGVTLIPNHSRAWYFRFLYVYKIVCVYVCVRVRSCLSSLLRALGHFIVAKFLCILI